MYKYTLFSSGSYEFSLPMPKFLSMNLSVAGLGDAVAPMPGVIEKVGNQGGICYLKQNISCLQLFFSFNPAVLKILENKLIHSTYKQLWLRPKHLRNQYLKMNNRIKLYKDLNLK